MMGNQFLTRRQLLASAGAALAITPLTSQAQQVRWSRGTQKPSFMLPLHATDCHHHIYDAKYPADPKATLRPGDALVSDYRELQKRIGIKRHVVVQPSTYGTDNACLLNSLAEFGAEARGVVAVDPAITMAELRRMHALGVRAARFNVWGGARADTILPVARKIAELGWHGEITANGDQIAQLENLFGEIPVEICFDHMGMIPQPAGTSHPAFAIIARLVEKGRTWVKLSGAYTTTQIGPPGYADTSAVARALVKLAPERLVWGSDWPHPTLKDDNKPDDAGLLDLLAEWVPEKAGRDRVLVTNAARLYDFPVS